MPSEFDEKAAQALVGKYVVVGVTYTDERDAFIEQSSSMAASYEQMREKVLSLCRRQVRR
jgi:hypothetical protein